MDRYTPDAWHDVLGGYGFAECRQAVTAAAAHLRFIAPADIIAEVKAARLAARQAAERERHLPLPGAVAVRQGLPDPRPLRETIREWQAAAREAPVQQD